MVRYEKQLSLKCEGCFCMLADILIRLTFSIIIKRNIKRGVRIMFPERLKEVRKEKGMTQIELAKALDVSNGTVAMWETGKRKPSFEMFEKLTKVFDKRVDYMLGMSDDLIPTKPNDMEVSPRGNLAIQEEYEDLMRKYSLLDNFGKKTIASILRMEFARCQEQGTLKSRKIVSVSVKVRDLSDKMLTVNLTEDE